MGNQGLTYVFTGEGKGKTSAALGIVVRAVGNGMTVAWVAWYKQASWRLSEVAGLEKLGVAVYLLGKGFYLGKQNEAGDKDGEPKTAAVGKDGLVVDTASADEHKQAAGVALAKAEEMIGKVDVLVLDEVNNAVEDKLITLIELTDLIAKRGKIHLILTGRSAHPKTIEAADLVTEMKKIKHPYDKGELATRGLDF